jgi:MoxR-like ATPase
MFNVKIDYLSQDDEVKVVQQTTSEFKPTIEKLFTAEDVKRFHSTVRKVPVAEELVRYAVQIADASRPNREGVPDFVNQFVNWGAGLRGAQNLILGAKARALFNGRSHVNLNDIQTLAHPVLRHRILPSYRAEAEGISVEKIVDQLLEHVTAPLK